MSKKFIFIFVLIFSYKLICNIINLIKITYYLSLYNDYINNNSTKIFQHKNHVINLLKIANVNNLSYPITQYTSSEFASNGYTSIFTIFPTKIRKFIAPTISSFENAIGTFKGRILECFSPIYWINCVIFLPRNILSYLNISAESIIIKILQLFYWIIGIFITLFSTDISNFIKSFFLR